MAVQTIILRPNATMSDGEESNLVRFPAETADAELHLLVSEITADDDATCVQVAYGSAVGLKFPNYEIPVSFLSAKIVYRLKASALDIGVAIEFPVGGFTSSASRVDPTVVDEYHNCEATITLRSDVEGILTNGLISRVSKGSGSSGKSGTITFTQIYIEISYDDGTGGETPVLYLKKSGAWEGISGKVYNKVNGAWVDGTLDALQADGLVVVQEVG